MNDQPSTYSDDSDVTLTIYAARGWGSPGHVAVKVCESSTCPCSDSSCTGVGPALLVPTARLLAMIDAEDPDAMRAYLLETVPEADSPEDVDERPGRDDPTERAQIDRSWALDRAAEALGRLSAVGSPAGALPLLDVAGWIIDGTVDLPEQILDTNMAGEVIS